MRTARRIQSLTFAALAAFAVASSPLPASAATLAVTALDCQPRHGGFICSASVTGGTSPYTYSWNGRITTGTTGIYSCPTGSTAIRTVTFTVTDSTGATASQSTQIDCSETW